jgi:DHA3 family macrolide efflux protein-like MFS transporter
MGAITWLAKSLTGRDDATGLVVFLMSLPWIVAGPFAGTWVDRGGVMGRRRVMLTSDLIRAALLVALWLFARSGDLSFALIAAAALLVEFASTPFVPARDALLPRLAEGRSLVRFNSAFQVTAQLASLVGLFLGGALMGTGPTVGTHGNSGVVAVLGLDGLTFLASAVTIALIVIPRDGGGNGIDRARAAPTEYLWRQAIRGVSAAAKDPLLAPLLVLTALDNIAIMGPAIVGATGFIKDDLHGAAGHWAWFEGTMALGYLVGAILVARFGANAKKGRMILWGMALDGLTYVPFFWVRTYPVALALIFVHGLFIPWIVVGRTTLIQQRVPEERQGQVFSLVNLTVQGMTALSALVAGRIAQACGAPTLFLLAGVFGTLCGVAGLVASPTLRRAA